MKRSEGGNTLKKTRESSGNDKNHTSTQDDLEVEYKEFTISEFLEIRKRPSSSLSKSKGEPDDTEEQGVYCPEDLYINRKKRIIFSIVILFFVLACLFGALSIIKYFLH